MAKPTDQVISGSLTTFAKRHLIMAPKKRKISPHPTEIPLQRLPKSLDIAKAVAIAYQQEMQWIKKKLEQHTSVLVSCDLTLTRHLAQSVVNDLANKSHFAKFFFIPEAKQWSGQSYGQYWLDSFKSAWDDVDDNTLLIIPIFETMIGEKYHANQQLGYLYEAAAWLSQNPGITVLAFHDNNFLVPDYFNNLFPVHKHIFGCERQSLAKLVLYQEGKKFHPRFLNIYRLHKYVSGLNVVRLRQILTSLQCLPDCHDENGCTQIYEEIREMTCHGNSKLSSINLETDVGGYTQAKQILQEEIIKPFHQKDQLFHNLDVCQIEEFIPKVILFSGPAGTGKIFVAKALAHQLNAAFTIVSCPEIKNRWNKGGKAYLHNVFIQARKSAPALIIFDKLDCFAAAIERPQDAGVEHSILTQMLVEMDRISRAEMVLIIGTTNFLSSINPALLRPGRFELHIHFPYPSRNERRDIINLYRDKFVLPLSPKQVDELAQRTGGYLSISDGIKMSGDQLNSLCRFLKRRLLVTGRHNIIDQDIHDALTQTGKYDSKGTLSQDDKWKIAVHQAGHCLLSRLLQYCEKVSSLSITTEDVYFSEYNVREIEHRKVILTREALLDKMCLYLGGRIAEEVILGDCSTGSLLDIELTTNIARDMVELYGMGRGIELVNYRQLRHFGNSQPPRQISLRTRNFIDQEIQNIIHEQYERGKKLLQENEDLLRILSAALLDKHTLSLEEIETFFSKYPL